MRGRPLANDDPEGPASCKWSSGGAGLLQMMIRRAAAVRGGIGDSSSCMEIDFFLCKIRFRTHIRSKEHKKKSQKGDRKEGGESTLTVSPDHKISVFYESP